MYKTLGPGSVVVVYQLIDLLQDSIAAVEIPPPEKAGTSDEQDRKYEMRKEVRHGADQG